MDEIIIMAFIILASIGIFGRRLTRTINDNDEKEGEL
jgi:hypothetical protein